MALLRVKRTLRRWNLSLHRLLVLNTRFYTSDAKEETRYNEANIQMLSTNLHRQLFPELYRASKATKKPIIGREILDLSLGHLEKHHIPVHEKRPGRPEVTMSLPPLLGNNIQEHFFRMGTILLKPYKELLDIFLDVDEDDLVMDMKFMENRWSNRAGWSRYSPEGIDLGPVAQPLESVMVLDVETCPNYGPWPLMAVARTAKAIYGWVSPSLFEDGANLHKNDPRLIPLEASVATLIIGHNVSFDRARLISEYSLKRGNIRFLDTLSMHCAVAGLSSQQRGVWLSHQKSKANDIPLNIDHEPSSRSSNGDSMQWLEESAMNNLADAVALHCNGYCMDKAPRDILVKGTIEEVRANFQQLMTYCANDVAATRGLFFSLWYQFRMKNPHPVTVAALLEMGSCMLPVNDTWTDYISHVETLYQQALDKIEEKLVELVERIAREGQEDESVRTDAWLRELDWTPVPAKYTKARFKADGSFAKKGEPRPIGNVAMFGKPAWYQKIYCSKLGRPRITSKTRILPYLLRMKWKNNPVHFLASHGWCYEIDKANSFDDKQVIRANGRYYLRIPHPEDEEANVGSLMSKKYLKHLEKGDLSTESPIIHDLLQLNNSFSFWVGYRERIKEQMVIWQDEPGVRLGSKSGKRAGMILPKLVTMGTVTRRAVEPTWMTATNSKRNLMGSELKSKIIAPEGYVFIGADVDSQELWISSLLGDALFGFAGASALGWMTLQGAKSDNTDLHSRTASILGMSRDNAKIFNYGRIYGAGVTYAAQLLQKFNPSMSVDEAKRRAKELYRATKGISTRLEDGRRIYVGGTETLMFNMLEHIARSSPSRTPALDVAISDSLLKKNLNEDDFLTSRVNWAVQSSGVDYLHMLLCSMEYLLRKYGIDGRLALTIHDEVRYLVKEEDQYRAALALQIANCWTRVMFAHRAKMTDLPLVTFLMVVI